MADDKNTVSEADQKKTSLMKKKKKEFDYLTSNVLMEHQKNLLASIHFKAVYNDGLFIPSIGITLVTAILAVLAQSELTTPETQSIFTISISILAAFSVFWQSLLKQLDYGGRAMLHDSAATALMKIYQIAKLRSREQRINDLNNAFSGPKREAEPRGMPQDLVNAGFDGDDNVPGEEGNDAPATTPEVDGDDHSTLSQQFDQAVQGCTSVVPLKIAAAFNALESRINVSNKRLIQRGSGNDAPKIAWEKVYPALYHQLTLTIIGSKFWPYIMPGAEWAVNKTISDFQVHDSCLLKLLVNRAHEIEAEYSSLRVSEQTRSASASRPKRMASEKTPLVSLTA